MSAKKRRRRPRLPAPPSPELDPDTGLPAVGKGMSQDPQREMDRTLRKAREQHAHKLRDHR